MQSETQLMDDIFDERIARARAILPADRLVIALRHSDETINVMKSAIRHRFPENSEEQVLAELIRRIEVVRELEQRS